MNIAWVGGLLGLILCGPVVAETFKYQSGMSVELGSTWNPLEPNDSGGLGKCLNPEISTGKPTITETYSEGFVESYEQLTSKSAISYSASGSGRFGIAKASATADFDSLREAFKDNRNIIYVVTGRRSYSPVKLSGVTLSDAGTKVLAAATAEGNPSAFYKTCGTALITSVTKETAVSLVYVFTASNAENREKVKSAISVAVSYGPVGGSSNLSIMKEIDKVAQDTQVNLLVVQSGALDKSDTVRELVGLKPGAISEIRDGLRKAIEGISWESSAIIAFNAERLDKHLPIPKGGDWAYVTSAYSRIDTMRDAADRLVRRYLQLKDILGDADLGYVTLKNGAREKIIAEMNDVDARIEKLLDTARVCLDGQEDKCKTPYVDVNGKLLPFMNIAYGQFAQWHGRVTQGVYDSGAERIRARAEFWPSFIVQNMKYARAVDLYRNDAVVAHLDSGSLGKAVSGGRLEFSQQFQAQYNGVWYCWGGVGRRDCDPWAADDKRHLNTLKTNDSFNYHLVVTDVEGGKSILPVPTLKSAEF